MEATSLGSGVAQFTKGSHTPLSRGIPLPPTESEHSHSSPKDVDGNVPSCFLPKNRDTPKCSQKVDRIKCEIVTQRNPALP